MIVEAAGAVFRQIDQPDGEALTVAVPSSCSNRCSGCSGMPA